MTIGNVVEDVIREARDWSDSKRDCESQNTGSPQKLENAKERYCPQKLSEGTSPPIILTLAQ